MRRLILLPRSGAFDCISLIQFLDVRVGKSLKAIAEEIGVSERTVQRRIRQIRTDYTGLEIREGYVGRAKTYRCIRRSFSRSLGLSMTDVMTLHRLALASTIFRSAGMLDHADDINAHIETLMTNLPRARRQVVEQELCRLSRVECIKTAKKTPAAKKGITDALQIASVAGRNITAVLKGGRIINGSVEAISHGLQGNSEIALRCAKGTHRVPLASIQKVKGIDDILTDAFR